MSTVQDSLERLKKQKLIEIDNTKKTNTICVNFDTTRYKNDWK
jgi:hypothetical protein